ncbi:recombinase family protein [Pseudobacteroides cellulosolvens]|uniref:Resolvase domain-containing protein n=1 Tax=Pseudobacteroides cellulosolvens ATCC 35603 = DSM 2933 TaxID=398512 RepID=A0A0L6JSC7_9FIRM|nr:recombinase family protein [Pseudobacteroides cellulosolvens]KNY28317.1 Resolvase domain-containing protein [Pseudobacteroides cellulosolvens ATCC 35603 = DSM 2933]
MLRKYGYIRVSDKDQNELRQIQSLKEAGVDESFILIDKRSGKDFDRPQYQLLRKVLREGDLLIIASIDRLGRNYKEIIKEWQFITQELKADIKILDMSLLDTTLHKDLLGTFISDLILQVLAYVAEQERINIKNRQAEGIAAAKSEGRHLGRPKTKIPEKFEEVYKRWKVKEITAKAAMEELNLKPTTFYNIVKSLPSEIKIGNF